MDVHGESYTNIKPYNLSYDLWKIPLIVQDYIKAILTRQQNRSKLKYRKNVQQGETTYIVNASGPTMITLKI